MGIIKKIFEKMTKSKNPDSKRFKWDMAKMISGHHVKYVTEEINGTHEVIGRSGALNIKGDELLVFAILILLIMQGSDDILVLALCFILL